MHIASHFLVYGKEFQITGHFLKATFVLLLFVCLFIYFNQLINIAFSA